MNGLPLVSVGIVAYCQVRSIRETLISALEQDYDNLEVVVADDGSTDGTAEVILEMARQYPGRLVPMVGGSNLGVTGNSNRALRACRGKYIAFMGGDDVLLPGKIRKQVEWLEADERRVLCGHDVELFTAETGERICLGSEIVRLRRGKGAADCMAKNGVYLTVSVMVRASTIPPDGFDERVPVASDWKFWMECLGNDGEYGYIDGVYTRYRCSPKTITHTKRLEIIRDRLVTLTLLEMDYPKLVRAAHGPRSRAYYELGIHWMRQNRFDYARSMFIESLLEDFSTWKAFVAFIVTLLPHRWSALITRPRSVPFSLRIELNRAYRATRKKLFS